jgi:UDP-N-acetylglucosamine 2-epimerase (non-hydrolysing)
MNTDYTDSMHVVCVAAARPNFMKIKPVVDALDAIDIRTSLVHTGQHYDAAMSDIFFDELGIRTPDFHLGVGSGSHSEMTAKVLVQFEELITEIQPDCIVVVGDVNSTLACALTGAKSGLLVAHVEAGLRSRDWSMPEEVNRVVADRVSDFLFAPSQDAVDNLLQEGYRPDQIHLVGNVMIDTLLTNRDRALALNTAQRLGVVGGNYGVVTLHRPANVDDAKTFEQIIGTLRTAAKKLPLIFPVHPRTRQTLEGLNLDTEGILLTDPLGYLDFLSLMAGSTVVLTDSGGIQEETTVLGVPCLTLRENTERPITIDQGTNRLVGLKRVDILDALADVLEHGVEPRHPDLWDGKAGQRIAQVLLAAQRNPPKRPTER